MTDKIVVQRNGIGFGAALFLLFLTLKLTGVIAWSWVWVTAPLWIPFAFVGGFMLIVLIITLIAAMVG